MATDTKQQPSFPTAIGIVVLLIVTAIVAQSVSFHRGFSGFWTVMPVAVVSLLLALLAFCRSRRRISAILAVIVLVIAIPNIQTIPEMYPLRHPVKAANFQDTSVVDVLHHVARSKSDFPVWRFHIATHELAHQSVSITIPDDAKLGDTLDALVQQFGGDYQWNWHKHCGNEPSPLCASFYVSNGAQTERDDYVVFVDRHDVFDTAAISEDHGRTKR